MNRIFFKKDHLNRCRKKLKKFNTFSSQKHSNRNRGELPQSDKGIYKNPAASILLNQR